jgi:hypothetical protein
MRWTKNPSPLKTPVPGRADRTTVSCSGAVRGAAFRSTAGAAKDSLVNAITATSPDATNKLQALIDAPASYKGEACPLKTYKSQNNPPSVNP